MLIAFFVACIDAGAGRATAEPAPFGRTEAPAGFWDHWGDGQAELDSYTLVQPRYGELRRGTAVWVFVTEDFTEAQRVKSDGGHGDEYPVFKHNDVRHFQTGIYDYDLLTSTFTKLGGPVGVPVKVSMGMQEWCGNAYSQLLSRPTTLDFTGHSYFDGEGDRQIALPRPAQAVLLDQMPTLARGIIGAWPAPGASAEIQLLDSLARQRMEHHDARWIPATVTRAPQPAPVTVPAGTFDAAAVTLTPSAGPSYTWQVEAAPPHRIVRWESSDGEVGELVATIRAPYWQLHGEVDATWLAKLGLAPAPLPAAPAP